MVRNLSIFYSDYSILWIWILSFLHGIWWTYQLISNVLSAERLCSEILEQLFNQQDGLSKWWSFICASVHIIRGEMKTHDNNSTINSIEYDNVMKWKNWKIKRECASKAQLESFKMMNSPLSTFNYFGSVNGGPCAWLLIHMYAGYVRCKSIERIPLDIHGVTCGKQASTFVDHKGRTEIDWSNVK